jgi:hypothetical protein
LRYLSLRCDLCLIYICLYVCFYISLFRYWYISLSIYISLYNILWKCVCIDDICDIYVI